MSLKLTHDNVSYVKSGLRILAGIAFVIEGGQLQLGWLVAGGCLVILAELLGILEEIV